MTNLPPVIVIEVGLEELENARIANMLTVLVDVVQHRLRSVHRTVVLLSLPSSSLFTFISSTGARDVRIVGPEFFELDYISQSAWNFVSTGDGVRLCADAMQTSRALEQRLADREFVRVLRLINAIMMSTCKMSDVFTFAITDHPSTGDLKCKQLQADLSNSENRVCGDVAQWCLVESSAGCSEHLRPLDVFCYE